MFMRSLLIPTLSVIPNRRRGFARFFLLPSVPLQDACLRLGGKHSRVANNTRSGPPDRTERRGRNTRD
jgi:hypothetical protein